MNSTEEGKVVFLVPGDPFVATTHVALRIEAERRGFKTWVVQMFPESEKFDSTPGSHPIFHNIGRGIWITMLGNIS